MLRTLQGGRAIAAVSVAAFHLSITMGLPRYGGQAVFREFTAHGDLGVDFFFVLSGFIIMRAHGPDIGHPERWRRYAWRRFVRIYPIYWLYTAAFALVFIFGVSTDASLPNRWTDWLTSLTLIRFTAAQPPLAVAWTLFHELTFYVLVLVLILSRRLGWSLLVLLSAAWMLLFQFPTVSDRTAFNVYFSVINLEFLMGIASCRLFEGKIGAPRIVGAGVAVLVGAGWLMDWYHGVGARIVLAAAFALLTAGFAKLELSGAMRVPNGLAFVGDASYSLYLVHLAVEGVLLKLIIKLQLLHLCGSALCYLVVLAGTVATGCIAYALVERPLLSALRRVAA